MNDQLVLTVSTEGPVAAGARSRAEEKVHQLVGHVREPVLWCEVRLIEQAATQQRPAVAEATLDINGTPVRAHVAAGDMDAAIDLLEERLRRRIARHEDRLHRNGKERRHDATHDNGRHEWRHGDLPTQRPEWFSRPADEREVIRHKTFALQPMTIDEAAFDLDALAHDFFLFTELGSGAEMVLAYGDDHGLLLHRPEAVDAPERGSDVTTWSEGTPAPHLTLGEAEERLDEGGERYVFFLDSQTSRGRLLYHRYDGHYGLITPD